MIPTAIMIMSHATVRSALDIIESSMGIGGFLFIDSTVLSCYPYNSCYLSTRVINVVI